MNVLIDTHCHLDLFPGIQQNAAVENENAIKTISVTNAPSFFGPNNNLFAPYKNIRVALGLHPQLAKTHYLEIDLFVNELSKTNYIGEIGLDGSTELKDSFALQRKIFEQILGAVKKQRSKVLTIHSRNAAVEIIDLLDKFLKNTDNKIILHWFSGNKSELDSGIRRNFYFSVNHKMADTEKGMNIIRNIPENLLLTETDAPFTFSGKIKTRTESLLHTINIIAKLKNKTAKQISDLIYNNFKEILISVKKN